MKGHLITAVSAAMLLVNLNAHAAEVTDIAQSTDEDRSIGIQFGVGYHFERDTGQISREQPCKAGVTENAAGQLRCAEDTHVLNRELDYERSNHWLDIDLRLGLPKNIELRIVLPIGVSDKSNYAFAKDVSTENSTIDPGGADFSRDFFDSYSYFKISDGWEPPNRSGLGDLRLEFNWLAMSQDTRPEWANLLFGVSYTAPTGQVRLGDNKAWGNGVHWLHARIAASRQIAFVEPYVQIFYSAPLGGSRGVFPTDTVNQSFHKPGHKLDFVVGTDFELYADPEKDVDVRLGVGASAGFQTAGRDRSALFEGLAASPCNGITRQQTQTPIDGNAYDPAAGNSDAMCGWLTQQPGAAANGNWQDGEFTHSGLTTTAPSFYFGLHAQVLAQFHRNVGLKLSTSWLAYTNHLLTNANVGKDRDGDETVSMDYRGAELNPDYNPTFDRPGHRFIIEGLRRLTFAAELYTRF